MPDDELPRPQLTPAVLILASLAAIGFGTLVYGLYRLVALVFG